MPDFSSLCGWITHRLICFMVVFKPLDDVAEIVHSGFGCDINAQELEEAGAEGKHTWKEGRNYNPQQPTWPKSSHYILFISRTQKLNWRIFLTLMMNGSSGLFMESASTLKDELVTTSRLYGPKSLWKGKVLDDLQTMCSKCKKTQV